MMQVVYKGECDYTGNWWNQYETVQGWIFYDDNGKFYLRVKHGKKFPDVEGRITVIEYRSWEDLLKDWYVPRIVKAEPWANEEVPPKNFEGNTDLDIIIGISMNFRQIFIQGWSNNLTEQEAINIPCSEIEK